MKTIFFSIVLFIASVIPMLVLVIKLKDKNEGNETKHELSKYLFKLDDDQEKDEKNMKIGFIITMITTIVAFGVLCYYLFREIMAMRAMNNESEE